MSGAQRSSIAKAFHPSRELFEVAEQLRAINGRFSPMVALKSDCQEELALTTSF
jgi:hypothetical protein